MVEKENCDICQKRLKLNVNSLYCMKNYHSKQKSRVIWACPTCYPTKEQEFLTNYATIYFFSATGNFDIKMIKLDDIDCYTGKKDQNGQTLRQKDCSHCQPWEKLSEDNIENKGLSTEMKVFGILALILVFIIGIIFGKISQKNKNNKK